MFRTRSLAFIKHATTLNRRNLQPTAPLLVPSSSSSSNGLPFPPVCPRWSSTSPSAACRSSTASLSNTTIRSLSSNSKDPHQEAIEKAQQLHAELNEMIAAQKAAQKAASEKPYSSTVKEFLRSSKAQLFNIFFAFVCVLLAYQIHGLRRGYKKLLGDIEERDEEVERLRLLLRTICDIDENDSQHVASGEEQDVDKEQHNDHQQNHPPSFSLALSEKCTAAIQSLFAQSDTQPGYTWIMGRKLASSDPMESARLTHVLREIIARELRDAVGNAVWSAEERRNDGLWNCCRLMWVRMWVVWGVLWDERGGRRN
ncbi:hypothetical protein HJC23_002585 [Cyclotella cryptica]|uniref:Uncharacterized protein n=1 Tax=Cyclotella cryptica TaxID=29204 RepID=A0ABD3P861_9STRA|eukprot:CCRYP_017690-RA/>CCRYP_017690-RA protein AED:0.13 eAED:0.13 QI:183/1/1/1/1/1/2/1139/312